MFKRCQILLTDWLEEHIRLIAKRNDVSFSEMVRIILCEGLLRTAPSIYPEWKGKINTKLLIDIAKEGSNQKTNLERKHQLTSRLYFEARKALEELNIKIKKDLKRSS